MYQSGHKARQNQTQGNIVMQVKSEKCWNGHNLYYRCTIVKTGERFSVMREDWDRKTAAEAKDYVCASHNVKRGSIRFI